MPILYHNYPLFRIRFKDYDIREVRKGNELEGGLYRVIYINKGPKTIDIGFGEKMNIPNYVGGYPAQKKEDFELVIPEDATAVEAKEALGDGYGYRSHSDGGFEDNECLIFFPAVTRDFHKDGEIYCKGRQRKYCFNGIYCYEKEEEITTTIPASYKIDKTTGKILEIGIYGRTQKVGP